MYSSRRSPAYCLSHICLIRDFRRAVVARRLGNAGWRSYIKKSNGGGIVRGSSLDPPIPRVFLPDGS